MPIAAYWLTPFIGHMFIHKLRFNQQHWKKTNQLLTCSIRMAYCAVYELRVEKSSLRAAHGVPYFHVSTGITSALSASSMSEQR